MAKEYDIIVVGAGLIGSAAARHLVEISKDVKVLLIGPEEPKVWGLMGLNCQWRTHGRPHPPGGSNLLCIHAVFEGNWPKY